MMNINTEINFCKNDLNDNLFNLYQKSSYLAVDTEAMGLVHGRDRLCVIQISNEDNITTYIKIEINIKMTITKTKKYITLFCNEIFTLS